MTGRVAAQPRKAIPESVGIASSMDLPPRPAMKMTHMIANESTSASRRIRRLAGVVGLPLMGWIDGAAHAATSSP
jgi:hypothetical protein